MPETLYHGKMKPYKLLEIVRLVLGFLGSWLRSQNNLALENLALPQQLATFKRDHPQPRISCFDRGFWVLFRRIWSNLRRFSFQRATSSELNAKIDEVLLTMTCRFNISEGQPVKSKYNNAYGLFRRHPSVFFPFVPP